VDQYLWSTAVVAALARALREAPELRLIAVIPRFPDQGGRLSLPPNLVGRIDALETPQRAGGDRVAVYSPENAEGTPIYVHAKVCVVDDTWAIIGSDNLNRRSWTHDPELSCAVVDQSAADDGGMGVRRGADPLPADLRSGRAPAVGAAGWPLLIWPGRSSPPRCGQSHQRNNGCAAVLTMRREVRHGRRLTRDHLAEGRMVVACRMPLRRPRTVLPGLRGRSLAGGDRRSEGGLRGLRRAP
jgi:hypothetical protein